MVTITDAIKHSIAVRAKEIHAIKVAALKTQSAEEYVCVSPDGKIAGKRRPTKEEYAAGWRMSQREYDKVIEHISPRHPQWRRYQAAKRQASLLLSARLLLRLGGEAVPEVVAVRRALKEGRLTMHARPRHARSAAFAALRYLRKLDNRLHRAPERFAAVEESIALRQHRDAASIKENANV